MALETGKYNIVCMAKLGKIEAVMDCKVDGNTFTGELSAMGSTQPVQNGVIDGESFSCSVKIKTPLGMKETKVSGTTDGNNISGTLNMKMIGELKYTGAKS